MTDDTQQPFFSVTNSPDTLVRLGDYSVRLYRIESSDGSIDSPSIEMWEEFEFHVVSLMVAAWKLPDSHLLPYCQEFMKSWLPSAPRPPQIQTQSDVPFLECIEAAKLLAVGFAHYQPKKKGVLRKVFGKSPGVAQFAVGGKYPLENWPLEPGKSDGHKEEDRLRRLYDQLTGDELLQHARAMRPLAFIARFAKCHPCPHMTKHFDWTSRRPEFARIVLADMFVPRKLGVEYPKSERESMTVEETLAANTAARQEMKTLLQAKDRGPR